MADAAMTKKFQDKTIWDKKIRGTYGTENMKQRILLVKTKGDYHNSFKDGILNEMRALTNMMAYSWSLLMSIKYIYKSHTFLMNWIISINQGNNLYELETV